MSFYRLAKRAALILPLALSVYSLLPPADAVAQTPVPEVAHRPLMQIGPGDSLQISVYDQPDMTATVYVSDDGTVPVALAGPVHVAGLSPQGASQAIEKAFRDGKYFKDPHVTITVAQSRSQRVSVLGEVASPARYPIDAKTSIFDLLALAGGVKETASSTIYILREDTDGKTVRYPIDLQVLGDTSKSTTTEPLQGGDSVFVPKAEMFYIYGEVASPAKYRIDANMTIVQAIVRAGGLTVRGSRNRIEITRKGPNGEDVVTKAKRDELIQPNDVIRVKESIF